MAKRKAAPKKPEEPREVCGIVMPISERDGCSAHHWREVLEILTSAADAAGYDGNLVSNAEHIGVIQQTIVDNLFDNPVVVCDVSTENPNVMFELGLRLAFDKPTIVVVDDKTKIQFDTSPIEHLKYPRDLRFSSIIEFKEKLAEKIQATVEAHKTPDHKTFLKAFKRYTAAKVDSAELPKADLILQTLHAMRRDVVSAQERQQPTIQQAAISRQIDETKWAVFLNKLEYLLFKYGGDASRALREARSILDDSVKNSRRVAGSDGKQSNLFAPLDDPDYGMSSVQ